MKIEDIEILIKEISATKETSGYIDCSESSGYVDNNQYTRILAAIKQNIALQQANAELTKKLEEVEKQGMEYLLQIEKINKIHKNNTDIANRLIEDISEYFKNAHLKDGMAIRLGDYTFRSDGSFYYDPIKEEEPIELKIKITENSNKKKQCPICGNPLGKYPAISREDNKTKICSNCGTLEALAAFKEAIKDGKNEQQEV